MNLDLSNRECVVFLVGGHQTVFRYLLLIELFLALGMMLICLGYSVRVTAMVTAKSNFAHEIAETKSDGHELVTHGIYRHVATSTLLA